MHIQPHANAVKWIETTIQVKPNYSITLVYHFEPFKKYETLRAYYKKDDLCYQLREWDLIDIPYKYFDIYEELVKIKHVCPVGHKIIIPFEELTRKEHLVS